MKVCYNQAILLFTAALLGNAGAELLKVNLGGMGSNELTKRSFNQSNIEPITGKHIFQGEVEVGTPGQKVTIQFDTGSYTFALNYKRSSFCQQEGCTENGAFDPSDSSTSVNTTQGYSASFLDGSGGGGFYFNDTLKIAGLTIDDYKVGLLEESNSNGNVIGMSLIMGDEKAPILSNFLANGGYSPRRVFSTYYGDDSGAVIFGGLDQSKYTGTLERIAVQQYNQFTVILTGVSTDCGVVNSNGYEILLDTGSDGNAVPEELYHQLHQAIGGKITKIPIQSYTDGPAGEIDFNYVLSCADARPLILDFSGKKVSYPPENFLVSLYDGNSPLLDSDGNALCTTNFFNGGDGSQSGFILGASFLRNLLVVWDADNAEVAIAQGRSSDDEDLLEITGDVPNAVTARDYGSPNSATTDTIYASPATESLTVSTILTSDYYAGPFKTSACTTEASSTSASSSPFFLSLVSATSSSESSLGSSSTIHSSDYSTATSAPCLQCSGSQETASVAHSSTYLAGSSSSASVDTELYSSNVSTLTQQQKATTFKTITSCSNNICSISTSSSISSILKPSTSSVVMVDSLSSTPAVQSSSAETIVVKPPTVKANMPSESSSGALVEPTQSKSASVVGEQISISSEEQTTGASLLSSSSSSTVTETTPVIVSSASTSVTPELSSLLTSKRSPDGETMVTSQTFVSTSPRSTSSVSNTSSVAISTFEGGSHVIHVPLFFKIFSSLF